MGIRDPRSNNEGMRATIREQQADRRREADAERLARARRPSWLRRLFRRRRRQPGSGSVPPSDSS